ncbi:DNA-binding response regulator, NarL/FixJ family, contains REC and HTH domains [Chitinophaga sp. CF118]|uniref:response regulator transcription factor n=1 Tax=Chitinophaga sp. CF118 TaxID=1884367 RepID=UPI0008F35A3F|nr:response regulator transcription factor [Chitinophaga sp. CF118]SFE78314.1 DNA-binding response regulator, NarL/FixJ family, contains REC and HTH domains [Chitinophaga sp. CF118]
MKNVRRNNAGLPGRNDAVEADGEHGDTHLLVQQLAKEICNIVFMDIDIPGLVPAEIANILKAAYPEMNVVLFTLRGNESSSEQVIPKPITFSPPASITDFIAKIYEATLQTNTVAIQKVLTFFNREGTSQPDPYGLSSRELQVLDCLVDGDTYKKIAEHCHISVGTVRSHIMNIYRKLNVNSRSGAIVKAIQERLIGN